jgi:hypothetical protein
VLDGQPSTWAYSQFAQTGQSVVVGNSRVDQVEATKRRQVEAHLATLDPDQQARLQKLGPRAAAREVTSTLNRQGLAVSERYVQQIWDDWTHTSGQRGAAARAVANASGEVLT